MKEENIKPPYFWACQVGAGCGRVETMKSYSFPPARLEIIGFLIVAVLFFMQNVSPGWLLLAQLAAISGGVYVALRLYRDEMEEKEFYRQASAAFDLPEDEAHPQ